MSIKILPVRFADNGFMTRPFALGGEPNWLDFYAHVVFSFSLESCLNYMTDETYNRQYVAKAE